LTQDYYNEGKKMLILGIESASLVASAALVQDGTLLAEYTLNSKKTHSQTLLPMIQEITRAVGLEERLEELDGIAIAKGPGSFTGLRIGSATAKGLAMTLEKPILAVPTLDAMAFQLYGISGLVCPIMDARRMQVYTGIYRFAGGQGGSIPSEVTVDEHTSMHTLMEQTAMSVEELIGRLNALGEMVTFLGDGCPVYKEQLLTGLTVPVRFAPSFASRQRAAAVAELGAIYLREGITETALDHKPDYLRKSQAERERDEKRGQQE
jgi:tRNA threonylcarbamoyl adenosine modification protein YeaZ